MTTDTGTSQTAPQGAGQTATGAPGWRLVWRIVTIGCVGYILYHGISVHGRFQGSLGTRWGLARIPIDLRALHTFWLAFFASIVFVIACLYAVHRVSPHISAVGFRIALLLIFGLYLVAGKKFQQWAWAADDRFVDCELILNTDEADLNVLSVLNDRVPNCAILARGGQQRVWIPPQWEDRRDEAVAILAANGYEARRVDE